MDPYSHDENVCKVCNGGSSVKKRNLHHFFLYCRSINQKTYSSNPDKAVFPLRDNNNDSIICEVKPLTVLKT